MKLDKSVLEEVLRNYGPKPYAGTHFKIDCPYCHHREAYVDIKKDSHPWQCWRKSKCGQRGNIYSLIKDRKVLVESFEQTVDLFSQNKLTMMDYFEDDKEVEAVPLMEIPKLWKRVYDHTYLSSRGLTERQFEKHKFYINKLDPNYVYVLVEHNGDIIGYVGRRTNEKEYYPKYDNSKTEVSATIFGIDEVTGDTTDLLLVEGVFDKFNTDNVLGLHLEGSIKCGATLGAKLSTKQAGLIRKSSIKRVHLLFERDVPKKIKEVSAELANFVEIHYYDISKGSDAKIDPGIMNYSQFYTAFSSPLTFIEANLNFVDKKI